MTVTDSRSDIICNFLARHQLAGWFSWRSEDLLLQLGRVSYWGLSFLLYLRDGERLLFVPELEPQDIIPAGTTVITYPWGNMACSDPFNVLSERLRDELSRRRIEPGSIGILHNSQRSSLPIMAAEQPPLPGDVLQKLTRGMATKPYLDSAFLALYLHKTEVEIERIQLANKVAQLGLDAWRLAIIPGATEAEAAAAAEAAIHSTIGKYGIVSARAWAMVQSGQNTLQAGCFNRSTGRQIESNDILLIELATCVNGYWSDLTRTEPVGQPTAEAAEILHAVSSAQRAAIEVIRPGISAAEVDAAARDSLLQVGLADSFTHATGHHTGFRYHDPGFAIAPGNRDLLDAGMVITIEPGSYVSKRGIGARIEDNIAVTNGGADNLSAERQELV